MNWIDSCSEDLLVPNVTEVCLTGVYPSKNNPKTTVFVFSDPQDVAEQGANQYENIVWSYTQGSRLNPTDVAMPDGTVKRKSINLGGIQLYSLLSALGVHEEEIPDFMTMNRNELANRCQLFEGLCVTCPMTGRVKSRDGVTRIQFKFPDLDFDSPETFAMSLEDFRNSFGPSDLDMSIHSERVRVKMQRPENAVTPVGADEGDEII